MEEFNLDTVDFFEDDFELPPEEFKELLNNMHDVYDLTDVDPLLQFAEEIEAYQICAIIRDFKKEVLKQ